MFYPPKFSITLVFYRCSTQSANVFSAKYILDANPPKFSTAKVLCYTVLVPAFHQSATMRSMIKRLAYLPSSAMMLRLNHIYN